MEKFYFFPFLIFMQNLQSKWTRRDFQPIRLTGSGFEPEASASLWFENKVSLL